MNERLRELAKQAYDHADSQGFFVTNQDCLMEKFAELIVRECIGVASARGFSVRTPSKHASEIKQHFGVEE